MKRVTKGHVTLKWYVIILGMERTTPTRLQSLWRRCRGVLAAPRMSCHTDMRQLGSWRPASVPDDVGAILSRSKRHCVRPLFRGGNRYQATHPVSSFIVDSADVDALPVAREELHALLEKPAMEGIPLLVLGNKSDLQNHLDVNQLIDKLDLKDVTHREVSVYGISAKEETNLDAVLNWLIKRAQK